MEDQNDHDECKQGSERTMAHSRGQLTAASEAGTAGGPNCRQKHVELNCAAGACPHEKGWDGSETGRVGGMSGKVSREISPVKILHHGCSAEVWAHENLGRFLSGAEHRGQAELL